jgi:DNA-binding NarL/FixJ family response regulator
VTRVVLAEDQPMVRAGFRALLDSRSDIEVVGEAATGAQALAEARARRPDVVVMDVRMPELKGGEPADLVNAIRVVAGGEALLAPSVTRRLIDTYVSRPPPTKAQHEGLDELTSREREVLELVATGLTNAEIANILQISPLTAKTHASRILMKLGARDRVQLVVIAY